MAQATRAFQNEDRILGALKKRGGQATVGDIATDTGLPYEETELAMRHMLEIYQSHLDVDDDGNLLYRFDPALKARGYQKGRRWYEFKKRAWAVFTWIFKVSIMVVLVGYTATFILLLIAFAIAGIAAASSQDNDDMGDVFMLPIYLIARILETVFWVSWFSGDFGGGRRRRRPRRQVQRPEVPLYKRIFQYVFGPEIERDELGAERAFARFVRARQGRITAADWASRTGLSLEQADQALTAATMRFRGDIDVADDGTLVYRFDDLRVSSEAGAQERGPVPGPIWKRRVQVPPLTGNTTSTNVWISIFNGFNLLMGLFFLSGASQLGVGLSLALGVIPTLFSLFFFAIPLMRRFSRGRKLKRAQKENERRELIEAVYLASSQDGVARPVDAQIFETHPRGDRVFADFEGDIRVEDDGRTLYLFPRVAEQLAAAERARRSAEQELVFGQTIFSSDEETLSMADAEMLEFDRKLARELGGSSMVEFDWESLEESATVGAR
ncbi:hypothetical protein DL240_09965 [Lujinxingia litoralis]|uniref:Uncharacterized protein n=1 Tax=Lujinxingia litoralis TaxID=2211119 RepID=A0A328C4C6_9DELT|nr:hypothetical protein [Lujinxingia litoralis]RAL22171.1 hypothetical protein DL240_09965 [Lujinxingia litoralis]